MTVSVTIPLSVPLEVPGGTITQLIARLPAPVPEGADELDAVAAMTGVSAAVLAEIDMADADRIYEATAALWSEAVSTGLVDPTPLALVKE